MRRALAIFLAVALVGCAESIVLPVDETLTHDEIVSRIKTLLKEELILSYNMTFLVGGSEERVSPSITRLRYQHTTPQTGPSLYTPGVSYDWTFIDIDTATKKAVRISIKTYRRGNFIDDRQHDAEIKLKEKLSVLKERANQSLQATPKSGAPER
jgi:hypothetical protein